MHIPHKLLAIILLMFIWLFAGHCARPESERILFDFESVSELDRFHWKCHTLFSLSDDHATHGKKSLKLELFPSDYPGLAPMLASNDWRGYKAFSFNVYNTHRLAIPLTVRIDDSKDYPDYPDRYNQTYILKPGANTITIPLDSLITSGTNRKLNLKMVYRVVIFVTKPIERIELYFDNIKLSK
jgi:hypothetical protein